MPTPNIKVLHFCDVCDRSITTEYCRLPSNWKNAKVTLGWKNGGFKCKICSDCLRDFDEPFKKLWAKFKASKKESK